MTTATNLGWVVIACLVGGCERVLAEQATKKAAPASLSKADGAAVATLTLTAEAEQRLAVIVAPAEEREVARTRVMAAFVERPKGSELAYRAPCACVVTFADGNALRPGARLAAGAPMFELTAWLSPSDQLQLQKQRSDLATARVQAQGAAASARARLDAAEFALTRAEELVARDAGSRRARDDARAERDAARAASTAAEGLQQALAALEIDENATDARSTVRAPFDAEVLDVSVAQNQTVASGTALITLARTGAPWLRVPVPSSDLGDVERDAQIRVRVARGPDFQVRARPIRAPASADPRSSTVDLWYEVEGSHDALAPGQRVEAELALHGLGRKTVVPRAAIVYDARGATWVYVRTGEHAYERRRLDLERADQQLAVVARGLDAGAAVVVQGVMELWGVEFGAGK